VTRFQADARRKRRQPGKIRVISPGWQLRGRSAMTQVRFSGLGSAYAGLWANSPERKSGTTFLARWLRAEGSYQMPEPRQTLEGPP